MKAGPGHAAAVLIVLAFAAGVYAQSSTVPGISSTARLELGLSTEIPITLSPGRAGAVRVSLKDRLLKLETAEHPGDVFFAVLATQGPTPDNPRWVHFGNWMVQPEQIGKPGAYTVNPLRARDGEYLWVWAATPLQLVDFYRNRPMVFALDRE